jgi:hypothetical protein
LTHILSFLRSSPLGGGATSSFLSLLTGITTS